MPTMEKLLSIGISDPDPDVRETVFRELSQETILFVKYLGTPPSQFHRDSCCFHSEFPHESLISCHVSLGRSPVYIWLFVPFS